jgi:predicted P-loop ATPase
MQTAGMWCVELAELESMTRAETSRVKAFISRTTAGFGRHSAAASSKCHGNVCFGVRPMAITT